MKNLIVIVVVAAINFSLSAQTESSLLWKISGNGLEKPSYLFGTIHMIPKKDYFFTDKMQEVFSSTDALVLEVDIFNLSLTDKIQMTKQMFLPDGKTIKDYMSDDEFTAFRKIAVDSLGFKQKKFDNTLIKIKPFFATALLVQTYIGKVKAYEEELNKKAKKAKMNFLTLETLDFQMNLANKMTIEEQLEGITNMEDYKMFIEMVTLYKEQKLTELQKMMLLEYNSQAGQEFMKVFIDSRNQDWIPKIETMAKEQSCFIAVGAGHLPGEKGVLQLLKEKGYSITPVK